MQGLFPPPCKGISDFSVFQHPMTLFPPFPSFKGSVGARWAEVPWYIPSVIFTLCCFPLASMGLADMMSPGESKLSTPLKADGKEEGVSQPESKSKVLPPPCMPRSLPAGRPCCALPGDDKSHLSSLCMPSCVTVCRLPHPTPSPWCGSESY